MRAVLQDLREVIRPRRGLLAFGLLLMAVNRLSGLVLPYSTRFLVDEVIGKRQSQKLITIVLIIAGATVIQGMAAFAIEQLISMMGHRLVFEQRQKVQRHMGLLPLSYFDANKVGALISRIMSDVDGLRNLVGGPMFGFVGGLTTTIVALFVLLWINPLMTVLVVVFLAGYARLVKRAFGMVRPLQREERRITADVTGRLAESLGAIRVVKSYHAEARESHVFATRLKRLLDNALTTIRTVSLVHMLGTLIIGILGAGIWLVGARSVLAGSMTVGTLMTFVAFLAYLVDPIVQATNYGTQITQALAGLDRIREVLEERPEAHDPPRRVAIGPIRGDIKFEHVCFSYEAGKRVIQDLSFHAAPGTTTALVGPSGAGKSTLISLLAAFHNPDAGRIMVDGVDLSTVRLDAYRTQLGVVLQDSFLFDGTIAENIGFSRSSATKEEIIQACRIAHVDEFAERLEHKYDTIVGERGIKLSGGQRQRASIARAILANPRILILDEATSSLDSESEEFIQEGLRFLMQNRTTFVIAHRLSTVRQADQILVLDRGRIVEQGSHESLCDLKGLYWSMYTRQRGMDENRLYVPPRKETGMPQNGSAVSPPRDSRSHHDGEPLLEPA